MKEKNRLYEIARFQSIPTPVLDEMWSLGKIVKCQKNTTIIRAKEPANSIYYVLSGKVIVYNLTRHGKRKIIFVLGKGNMVNDNVTNSSYSATFCDTIEESTLFAIGSKTFLKLLEQNFSLTKAILSEQEWKMWRLSHQLKNTMGSIYMERKLAAKLWKLARDFGSPSGEGIQIDLNMTITFLADLMGAPRETISRLCATLTDYGLMKMERRKITITDPDRMAHFYKEGIVLNEKKE